jgi:hypothetical protein
MISNVKLIGVSLLLGALLGSVAMYKLRKVEPKVITNTDVVHDVRVVERVIKGKDGSVVTEIIHETKTETKEITKPAIPKYRVALMSGYSFEKNKPDYGLQIIKPVNENLEVGVYFKQEKEVGFTIGWGF